MEDKLSTDDIVWKIQEKMEQYEEAGTHIDQVRLNTLSQLMEWILNGDDEY